MRLLVSLGTSWAIVPEAFLHPDHEFAEVHVLTTASERIDAGLASLLAWFAENAPDVELSVTRVRGFTDLADRSDHERFEEALYRWFVARRGDPEESAQVCLSGGFKTMSAAVQQAAEIFGCAGMFHVLCASNPSDSGGIAAARAAGEIHWIELGPRRGWPQFRTIDPSAWPLFIGPADADASLPALAPPEGEPLLRERIDESLHSFQRVAERWEELGALPFQSLALWPEPDLAWLRQPLDPGTDADWVAALPKVELHCHLGGFASHGAPLAQVRAAATDPSRLPPAPEPAPPPGWPLPAATVSLPDYMALGDATGSALLKDPGCLRRHCELLCEQLAADGVRYAEIRCSPANYADPARGRSPWDVLRDIRETFQSALEAGSAAASGKADPCHVNLILIATRRERGDYRADISRHLALGVTAAEHWTDPAGCRVVGVDLAGYEDESTRAHYFREEFTAVHRCGLALTVHAGENDDAEGVWRAVFDLSARRLGHALHLVDSPELMRSVADRGIGVEMCPYANSQIKGYRPPGSGTGPDSGGGGAATPIYPLKRYLEAGIRVTVNTDNIGISAAGLGDNLLLAARLCPGLTRLEILRLLANGIETAFVAPCDRADLRADFERRLPRPGDPLGSAAKPC